MLTDIKGRETEQTTSTRKKKAKPKTGKNDKMPTTTSEQCGKLHRRMITKLQKRQHYQSPKRALYGNP